MFDKRLIQACPESKKYIAGNILLQWLELAMNAVMILMVARTAEQLWLGTVSTSQIRKKATQNQAQLCAARKNWKQRVGLRFPRLSRQGVL